MGRGLGVGVCLGAAVAVAVAVAVGVADAVTVAVAVAVGVADAATVAIGGLSSPARISAQTLLRAPPLSRRTRRVSTPRAVSRSTTSRMAKAQPSSTARVRCAGPWAAVRP